MKQYVLDGFSQSDHARLKHYLDQYLESASIDGIYWLELEQEILTPLQAAHEACSPHVFALMLEQTSLSCEFLVRIKTNIKCDCMGNATEVQRNWLVNQADAILEKLSICV